MLKRNYGRVAKKADTLGRYKCSNCQEWKYPLAYNKNRQQKSGLNYMCKPCSKMVVRGYNLPSKYGITVAQYAEMLLSQGSKCACCKNTFSLEGKKADRACVDHNHNTGEVRAILCGRCNLAAGNVLDSSERAEQIMNYLKSWKC